MFNKNKLKPGVFGEDSNGELFVVAGDILIYEDGMYDDISELNNNLEWASGAYIKSLYKCKCFAQIKDGHAELIWKREEKKEEKATESNDTITITRDEFFKIADKVNAEWMRVAEDKGDMDLVGAIVGLQNNTFAAHLASELFG